MQTVGKHPITDPVATYKQKQPHHSRRTNINNPRTTTIHCGRPHLWTTPARLLTCRSWTFLRQTWGVKRGETVQQKMRRTTVKKQMNVTMTTVGTMVGVVKNIMQRVPKTRQQCQDVAVGAVVGSGSGKPSSKKGEGREIKMSMLRQYHRKHP